MSILGCVSIVAVVPTNWGLRKMGTLINLFETIFEKLPAQKAQSSVFGLASAVMFLMLGGCGGGSTISTPAEEETPAVPRSVQLVPATDRSELEAVLKAGLQGASGMLGSNNMRFEDDATAPVPVLMEEVALDATSPSPESGGAADGAGAGEGVSFTDTNVQEAGVDEADLVKYDGDVLYVGVNGGYDVIFDPLPIVEPASSEVLARDSVVVGGGERRAARIVIARTLENPARTETLSTITLAENFDIEGFYLFGSESSSNALSESANRIAILGHTREACGRWGTPWCWQRGNTTVILYDVSTPEAPTVLSKFETDAHRVSSRRVGNQLYLATRFAPSLPGFQNWVSSEAERIENQAVLDNAALEDLLPTATLNDVSQPLVTPENCFISPPAEAESVEDYIHTPAIFGITQLDLTSLEQVASICAVGQANGIYASAERLFVYAGQRSETDVHGFALKEEGPAYTGSGSVVGTVGWRNNSFRFSALGDQLRVITSQGSKHRLTILQHNADAKQYETLSVLPNEARPDPIGKPNESIFGVRFLNDRAYVVTFRRTDPLYVINLSDATDPFIEGELELPGFSDYLHPVNDYLLLGVGRSATDTGVQLGVKLALFDVSNPALPTTLSEFEIGDRGSNTPLSFDHKAFAWLPNAETGEHRFAFPVNKYELLQLEDGVLRSSMRSVLSLWTLQDNTTSALLGPAGEIVSTRPGNFLRGVMNREAVHFIVDSSILSADWASPDTVSVNNNPSPQETVE